MEIKIHMTNTKINKLRYDFFCILWIIYYSTLFMDITAWYVLNETESLSSMVKLIRYLIYLSLAVLILSRKYIAENSMLRVILCSAILVIQSVAIDSKILIALLLFAFAASEFDCTNIIKCTAKTQALLLFLTIAMTFFAPGLSVVVYESDRSVERNLLGFAWAFHAPNLFLFVFLQYIYIKKQDIKLIWIIAFEILSIVFYCLTKTRTPLALTTLIILLILLLRHSGKLTRFINKHKLCWEILPCVTFIISLCFTLLYKETDFFNKANTILHDRIRLANSAYQKFGVKFWGQEISWVGSQYLTKTNNEYNIVDNAYMQILIKYGIIITIFTLVIYCFMIRKFLKAHDCYMTSILGVIVIYGLVNPCLLDLLMNPFLLLIFSKPLTVKINDKRKIPIIQNISDLTGS